MENKTNYPACIESAVNIFVPKYIKWISRGVFLFVHRFLKG